MAFQHGKDAVLKLHDGSSLRDVSAYVTSTGLNRMKDAVETTTIGGSTAKSYIVGLKDATIPLEGNYDPTVDGYFSTMYDLTTTQTFEYSPYGTTGGYVKYSGSYIMTSLEINTSAGEKGSITAEIQISGAVTKGTN